MAIDKDGRPYLSKTKNKVDFKDYDLEANGFFKKLIFREISGKKIYYRPIPNSELMTQFEAYTLRIWKVTALPCSNCVKFGGDFDFLKKGAIESGLFKRCFLTDITIWFLPEDKHRTKSEGWELVEERPITNLQEIIEMVSKGEIDFVGDFWLLNEIKKKLE